MLIYSVFRRACESKHLLDYWDWFLDGLYKQKNGPEYIVAGDSELSLFSAGDHMNLVNLFRLTL